MSNDNNKVTLETLHQRQKWPLEQKIDHSLGVIDQFISRCEGKVFVSWSGGKDSTVALDLCRLIKSDILAVFSNTGNEFPDIVRFVKQAKDRGENVQIVHPKLTLKQVFAKYGFPLVSKETAERVHRIRLNPNTKTAKMYMSGEGTIRFKLADRWKYLVKEPYETHQICCQKLKKDPLLNFEKTSGLFPIIGTMACESAIREHRYVADGGCNVFDEIGGVCKPLSIWTEEDVKAYIEKRNLKIADIYSKGARRTGCVCCGFGAQFSDDNRFDLLYREYPKLYNLIMSYTNNGITFREALSKMLSVVGRALPDENIQPTLF